MYVWRLPLFSFAVLASTAVLAGVLAFLLWLRSRTHNAAVRGMLSGGAVAAVLTAPFLVHTLTRDPLAKVALHGLYVDPPRFIFWLPSLFAVCVILLTVLLFPARPASTLRYRASFVALLFLFALLNSMNFCAPEWCERFGFPFAYSWWSDAIMMVDGRNLTAGFSTIAILLNATTIVGGFIALSVAYRRYAVR